MSDYDVFTSDESLWLARVVPRGAAPGVLDAAFAAEGGRVVTWQRARKSPGSPESPELLVFLTAPPTPGFAARLGESAELLGAEIFSPVTDALLGPRGCEPSKLRKLQGFFRGPFRDAAGGLTATAKKLRDEGGPLDLYVARSSAAGWRAGVSRAEFVAVVKDFL